MNKPSVRNARAWKVGTAGLAGAGLIGASIALIASQGAQATASDATTTPIKHVVVLFDENVSYDHYFGTYPNAANTDGPTFTAASNTPANKNLASDNLLGAANPNSAKPFRLTNAQAATCSQNHNYNPEQLAEDYDATTQTAKMDKFPENTSKDSCTPLFGTAGLTMGYFDGNTATAEWNYAQNYAMSDNSWDDNFGPSTVGALNVISGQTYGGEAFDSTSNDESPTAASAPTASGLSAIDPATHIGTVIGDPDPVYDDCADTDHTASSNLVGMQPQDKNIGDLLNAKNITWGWFQGGFTPTTPYAGASTYAKCDTKHLNIAGSTVTDYSPHHEPFEYYKTTSNPHHLAPTSDAMIGHNDQANHQYDLTAFDTALDQGNLPAVSYLKAAAYQDGHPSNSDPIDEEHFITREINAIENSPEWASTAIIIAYDDSDGWYDHVAPTITNGSNTADDAAVCTSAATSADPLGGEQDRCGPSQRLPLLVISPFAKQNYIDHTQISQASIVKFIEQNWGLSQIGNGSFDATDGSIDSMFDFQNPQERSVTLKADGEISSIKPVSVEPAGGFSSSLAGTKTTSTYGKPASIPFHLTSGGSVAGGTVTATVSGKAVATENVTGASGAVTLPATEPAGAHTVQLAFSGSAHTKASSTTSVLTVSRAATKTTASVAKHRNRKDVVTVKVTEPGSAIKVTGPVTGVVNGKTVHGTVRNGVARFTVKVHAGVNHVKFTFGPTSNYVASATKKTVVRG
ncbi:MAG TPA: alkaline phosphatase family protein [Marmoricola sp.]|jgi:phospholipase C|nr:alkaline phosphatase family protein [Marmoricola sp.]